MLADSYGVKIVLQMLKFFDGINFKHLIWVEQRSFLGEVMLGRFEKSCHGHLIFCTFIVMLCFGKSIVDLKQYKIWGYIMFDLMPSMLMLVQQKLLGVLVRSSRLVTWCVFFISSTRHSYICPATKISQLHQCISRWLDIIML